MEKWTNYEHRMCKGLTVCCVEHSRILLMLLLLLLLLSLLQLNFHSVTVVLTQVQTKQITINIHKETIKIQHKQYKNIVLQPAVRN